MIYDKLENIGLYKGFHPNVDLAIQFILEHDLSSLSPGKTEIAGDQVYVNVQDTTARPFETRKYEVHQEYMDLQIDLTGMEMIQIGNSSAMEMVSFDSVKDAGTVKCHHLTSCIMGPDRFILCMPMEPHKACIAIDENTVIRKCVFKIHR